MLDPYKNHCVVALATVSVNTQSFHRYNAISWRQSGLNPAHRSSCSLTKAKSNCLARKTVLSF